MHPLQSLGQMYVELSVDSTSVFRHYIMGATDDGMKSIPLHLLQTCVESYALWYDYAYVDVQGELQVLPVLIMRMRIVDELYFNNWTYEVIELQAAVSVDTGRDIVGKLSNRTTMAIMAPLEVVQIVYTDKKTQQQINFCIRKDDFVEHGTRSMADLDQFIASAAEKSKNYLITK